MALHLHGTVLPEGRDRDVFVTDARITFEPVEDARTVVTSGYLVPGLVDAHAHLGLSSPAPADASPEDRARASAKVQLDAGVLAIREPGGPNRASLGIGPEDGLPRTFTAGHFLAPTGGYIPGLAREVIEEELPEAAEEEARASGAWAKVIGDFLRPDGRLHANFGAESLQEAARRVHSAGGRIAIHTGLSEVIEMAIEAEFDSIEHGTELHDDHIAEMAKRSIALVPTLLIRPAVLQMIRAMGMPSEQVESMRKSFDLQPGMVRKAAEAGVLVLAGTDAGMGPHGRIREEVQELLDAGLSSEAALAAASWEARRYLGLPGIEEGAPADLVAYADDPRGDVEVLAAPLLLILDGRLVAAGEVDTGASVTSGQP